MIGKLKSRPLIILLAVLFLFGAGIGIVSANHKLQKAEKGDTSPVQSALNTEKDTSEKINNSATSTEVEPDQQEQAKPAAIDTDKQNAAAVNSNDSKKAAAEKKAASTKTTSNVKPAASKPQASNTAPSEPATPSRGGGRTLTMLATAYEPGPISNGKWAGISHLGTPLGYGIVAVDPNVIPLGSRLYIEGYGEGYAADTGGAIKGNRIDLCYNTYEEAMEFGMKYVKVTILSQP